MDSGSCVFLMRHLDAKKRFVELEGTLFELSNDVMSESLSMGAIVKAAAFRVFLGHVERRGRHLWERESHRFVQIVNALQEVSEVTTRHSDDLVVAVVREVLNEALAEEDHEVLGTAVSGDDLRACVSQIPHGFISVRREKIWQQR